MSADQELAVRVMVERAVLYGLVLAFLTCLGCVALGKWQDRR